FRLGAHLSLGRGDVVEVPAGRVERDEDVAAAARRGCEEEIGGTPQRLRPGLDLMPSAGAPPEDKFFCLRTGAPTQGPVRPRAADEHEDTRPLRVPIDRALEALAAGGLHYGAAIVSLQWLALNRARLAEVAKSGVAR